MLMTITNDITLPQKNAKLYYVNKTDSAQTARIGAVCKCV